MAYFETGKELSKVVEANVNWYPKEQMQVQDLASTDTDGGIRGQALSSRLSLVYTMSV